MTDLTLISFDICPYVQRSTIVLEEKGVPYEIEFIDLADKPNWFLEISPHGKVPVLRVGDAVLFESAVILEYLDEIHEPRLHPDDPLERARDRSWFSVADALAQEVFLMMIAEDRTALEQHAEVVRRNLAALTGELGGPLWRGEDVCAMDAVTYPALQRLGWLDEIYPELDLFGGAGAIRTWRDALAGRRSVVASTVPDVRERFMAAIREHGAVHRRAA